LKISNANCSFQSFATWLVKKLKDSAKCNVTVGTHKGKSGTERDINMSKGGNVTITVVKECGIRFVKLAKNIGIISSIE